MRKPAVPQDSIMTVELHHTWKFMFGLARSKETHPHLQELSSHPNSTLADAPAGLGEEMAPTGRPHPGEGDHGREANEAAHIPRNA